MFYTFQDIFTNAWQNFIGCPCFAIVWVKLIKKWNPQLCSIIKMPLIVFFDLNECQFFHTLYLFHLIWITKIAPDKIRGDKFIRMKKARINLLKSGQNGIWFYQFICDCHFVHLTFKFIYVNFNIHFGKWQ